VTGSAPENPILTLTAKYLNTAISVREPIRWAYIAVSQNAIHPDAYLNDLLQGNHEVIGSLINEFQPEAADIPIYFFPANGIYAAALSENEVLDAWLSWPCYPLNW